MSLMEAGLVTTDLVSVGEIETWAKTSGQNETVDRPSIAWWVGFSWAPR